MPATAAQITTLATVTTERRKALQRGSFQRWSLASLTLGGALVTVALIGSLTAWDRGVQLTSGDRQGAERVGAGTPRPSAPIVLQTTLDELSATYGESVGIAVTDVTAGWTAGVDAERTYPQQSVSKLWVAIALMRAVDQGRIRLDSVVTLTDADRSVFYQPLADRIDANGYETAISDLLRRALVESDNAANDRLMRELGGPDGVAAELRDLGLTRVKVGAFERDLQARTAGLIWQPDYGIGWNFQAAREALPREVRQAAMDAYLADPPDGTSPAAITEALAALSRGQLLSEGSTARLLSLMQAARTGPRRLKAGLPAGWSIAHKTGTGQDFRGASVGINDVGLLTAPDGHTYAVAVMMRETRKSVPERLAFMQAVTRAVAGEWSRSTGRIDAD